MRLWHKDLISVLPRQQLLGQWRECCLIAKNIHEMGTPNHLLVNKIMDYPISDLFHYGILVENEMIRRGYKCDFQRFAQYFDHPSLISTDFDYDALFNDWHADRYLRQCFSNLQEKFDCGGIQVGEWSRICDYLKWRDLK